MPSHKNFTHLWFINHLLRPAWWVVWENGATNNLFPSFFFPSAWGSTCMLYFLVSLRISPLSYFTLISLSLSIYISSVFTHFLPFSLPTMSPLPWKISLCSPGPSSPVCNLCCCIGLLARRTSCLV